MTRKRIKPVVTLSTKTGDIAKAMVPGECYLANSASSQGLGAPKITAKDVRLTLHADHPLVKAGFCEDGTRFIVPTPSPLAYYIGHVEQGLDVGEIMVATEDASFDLDLTVPGVKVIPPARVGPRNGVRGDRSKETARTQAKPHRAVQQRSAKQRFDIKQKNAQLLRVGGTAMTQEEIEAYLKSLEL